MLKIKSVFILTSLFCCLWAGSGVTADINEFGNVKLPVLQGSSKTELSLSDFKGKVVLLDLWASWCGPCRLSFPRYQNLYDKYRSEGFVIVGVNLDADANAARDFLKRFKVSFVILRDDPEKKIFINKLGGVETMPTAYLIDRQGKIVEIKEGFNPGDEVALEAKIEKLL